MTAHEVAAIEFLKREVAGDPASAEPLRSFLLAPTKEPGSGPNPMEPIADAMTW